MTNQEPFRSRPKIERDSHQKEPEATPERQNEPSTVPDESDIIDGVIESEDSPRPRQMVAPPRRGRQPIALPDDEPSEEDEISRGIARPGLMLVAIGLLIGGIFFTLLNVANLPDVIEAWWPMASLSVAFVWALGALLRRNVTAFLAGSTVVGLSISLLIDTQDIAQFQETAVGIILMSFGLAIVMRGLLLRSVKV